jgi:transcriptional regulator with XRE-family HTH domain
MAAGNSWWGALDGRPHKVAKSDNTDNERCPMPTRRPVTDKSQEPRNRFTEELRSLRAKSGLSLRELGKAVNFDYSYLGRMESGDTIGGPEVAIALDKHYATTHLAVLWELALHDPTQFRERYRQYMAKESEATSLQLFAPGYIPGLLQTEGYARETLAMSLSGDELAQQVRARMARQERLSSPRPPHMRVVLAETALRTPLRDLAAWRKQLEHLAEAADRPTIVIQVVPMAAGPHPFSNTDIHFLRLPEGRTVAWVETALSGELVEEASTVERLQLSYDQVRDLALSPAESRELITKTLEEVPCERPESI